MRVFKKIKLKDKNITIIGMGETGQGAAILAKQLGANVLISDSNEIREKTFHQKAHKLGIKVETGGHTSKIYNSDLWILSPGVPNNLDIVKNASDKKISIISEVEFASWFTNKPIIGVTGSNGKTTTVNIINSILHASSLSPVLTGNMGYAFSRAILNDITKCDENRVYIVELSSFQLENINSFKPFISILLNITPDHQDRYETMEKYIEAKMNIVINHDMKSHLLYNSDDNILVENCKNLNVKKTGFGLKNNSENMLKIDGSYIQIGKTKLASIDSISLKGMHNLSNILAAVTAAKILNVSNECIAKVLPDLRGIEHRLEKVSVIEGVTYYNDSKATNVEAVKVAINSFDKNIFLILGGQDKGGEFSVLLPDIKNKVKRVIAYGDAANIIKTALGDAVKLKIVFNLKDAVKTCHNHAQPGDVILLSPGCASFDQFKNFEERGKFFKTVVNEMATA